MLLCLVAFWGTLEAQNISLPQPSQQALLSQTIGMGTITVTYSRPAVKGREVWGGLVPMDQIWRAGANDNTTVAFSHDVKIGGKTLQAGIYGLHMIPTANDWTIIFSTNHTSWGSFFYQEDEDALRTTVKPRAGAQTELLTYDIIEHNNDGATLVMRWEKKEVPIRIDIDIHEQTLASIRNELRNLPGFGWQGFAQAANYCVNNNLKVEDAVNWADIAMTRNRNFNTVSTKANVMRMMDKEQEYDALMAEAIAVATNAELNAYGYLLLGRGAMEEAIQIFQLNTERNPKDANVWDSYGEGLIARNGPGDKKAATKALKKSLSLSPAPNVKANSERLLKQLESM